MQSGGAGPRKSAAAQRGRWAVVLFTALSMPEQGPLCSGVFVFEPELSAAPFQSRSLLFFGTARVLDANICFLGTGNGVFFIV